jgi:hypothetical protein
MNGKVVATILPIRATARPAQAPRKKLRLTGRWKPNGRRAIVLPAPGDDEQFVAFLKSGPSLKGMFVGSSEFIEKHLRARGLDRTALWISGDTEAELDRLLLLMPRNFYFAKDTGGLQS